MKPGWVFVPLFLIGSLLLVGRVSRREPIPEAIVFSHRHSSDVSRCAECHDEICESYAAAPHQDTLQRAASPDIQELFADRDVNQWGDHFRFSAVADELHFAADRFPTDCRVDWVFGSGHHARTPVMLREGSQGETALVQLHVSWFADGALGVTPGSEDQGGRLPSLGIDHTPAETRRCFGCHASHLDISAGRIDFSRSVIGINCSRCHIQTDQHLASEGEVPTGVNWKSLSPLESINRCGECHRRADEFTADELLPTASHLARFAPVGLVQSPCFQKTHGPAADRERMSEVATRLDCTTCHNPHQPAPSDPWFYVQSCLKCHRSTPRSAPDCSTQPMTSQCVACHMPKVPINEHLSFTDHWIRVREESGR